MLKHNFYFGNGLIHPCPPLGVASRYVAAIKASGLKYYVKKTVFSFHYTFDPVTGNLTSRDIHGTEEHFFYDTDGKHLNRLAGTGPDEFTVSETYTFADNGNIAHKHGVGQYFYDTQKKNAVTQIDIPGLGDIQEQTQQVHYNHFNSASEIEDLDHQMRVNLEYGPDDQRRLAEYWDDSGGQAELIKTRIYAGAFEKQINANLSETEVHYISAGGMLVAMYVVEAGVGSYYYPHQDHLGSIIHITDANGDIVYTQSFDAWGRTRNPDDLTYTDIPERPDWLWRGYTGHEHLDEFGLINMNGRLYDPVVGRMLSPDNYVQSPDFSQSYNRYSYVWNNPLKYTDPSGEILWAPVIALAIWSGGFNVATNYSAGNVNSFGEGLAYFGVGAAAAVAGGVAGQAVGVAVGSVGFLSGATSGAAGGFAGGFVSGAGNSWLGGGSFGDGLMSGLKTGGIGAGVAGLMGGIQGGINAKNMGLDFWDGTGTSVSEMSGTAALPSDPGEPTNIRNSQELHEFRSKNYPGSDDYVQGTFKGVDRFTLAKGKGYTVENGQMYNADMEAVHGITIYERPSAFASGGKSFIGISPNMITHSNNLHAVMGHEVIHAYHYNIGFMGRYGIEASEYYAHKFSASVPHSTQEGAKLVYPTLGNRVPLPRNYVYPSWVPNF